MDLIIYLNQHGLPAIRAGQSILTVNEYTDQAGRLHRQPIILPANLGAVRQFLGY
jgi:hypothetical protein